MTNWTKPLPKHTDPNYYECYAKIVLEELFPKEFVNLEIKDTPDLQMGDGKYGVEVVTAMGDDLKAERIYSDITYGRVRNVEDSLKEIEKCGYKVEDGLLLGGSITNLNLILQGFDDKLNKLNQKGYKFFNTNYLFIHSYIHATEEMIIKAIQDMQQRQMNSERQFYKIFILVPGYCYCLDLFIGNYEEYRIEFERQYYHAVEARKLVERHGRS